MNVMLNVEKGFRLPPPAGCPKAVYQLMVQTWNPKRKMRPTFSSIHDRLEMAYDMMFPDEDDQEGTVAVDDEDYGELEEIYLGVEVPTEENLDDVENLYLMEPTPVAKEDVAAAALVAELEAAKNPTPKLYVGRDVGQKPDRFSTFGVLKSSPAGVQKFGGGASPSPLGSGYSTPSDAAASPAATIKPTTFGQTKDNKYVQNGGSSPSMAYKNANRESLRKQKVAPGAAGNEKVVEYTSSAKVAEVLALSRQKETQSAVENHGVHKVAAMVGWPSLYASLFSPLLSFSLSLSCARSLSDCPFLSLCFPSLSIPLPLPLSLSLHLPLPLPLFLVMPAIHDWSRWLL